MKVGRLRLKSDSIRERARSRSAWILLGTLMELPDCSGLSPSEAAEVTSLGLRLMFSVLDETKMGVLRPGMPTGKRGGVGAALVVSAVVVSTSLESSTFFSCLPLLPFLSRRRLCLCLSFNRALKGLGLRRLRPAMMEGPAGSSEAVGVGSMTDASPDEELGRIELLPRMELLRARLNDALLLDTPPPKEGLD